MKDVEILLLFQTDLLSSVNHSFLSLQDHWTLASFLQGRRVGQRRAHLWKKNIQRLLFQASAREGSVPSAGALLLLDLAPEPQWLFRLRFDVCTFSSVPMTSSVKWLEEKNFSFSYQDPQFLLHRLRSYNLSISANDALIPSYACVIGAGFRGPFSGNLEASSLRRPRSFALSVELRSTFYSSGLFSFEGFSVIESHFHLVIQSHQTCLVKKVYI